MADVKINEKARSTSALARKDVCLGVQGASAAPNATDGTTVAVRLDDIQRAIAARGELRYLTTNPIPANARPQSLTAVGTGFVKVTGFGAAVDTKSGAVEADVANDQFIARLSGRYRLRWKVFGSPTADETIIAAPMVNGVALGDSYRDLDPFEADAYAFNTSSGEATFDIVLDEGAGESATVALAMATFLAPITLNAYSLNMTLEFLRKV